MRITNLLPLIVCSLFQRIKAISLLQGIVSVVADRLEPLVRCSRLNVLVVGEVLEP